MTSLTGLSLGELAAVVAEAFRAADAEIVIVGGSAITVRAPEIYTSCDIDVAVISGFDRATIRRVMYSLGFENPGGGRVFSHPEVQYTVDFVAETPFVDARAITRYETFKTAYGSFKSLELEDAILDRLAHYLHWNDSQARRVAESVATTFRERIAWKHLEGRLQEFDLDPSGRDRLRLVQKRMANILRRN